MILSAQQIAAALDGQINTQTNVTAPGPGHGKDDRSLSVSISPSAPDGFLVNSFAGDDRLICKDYVREKLGLPAFGSGYKPEPPNPETLAKFEADQQAARLLKSARFTDAARIWKEAKPIAGTLAESYLVSRLAGAEIPEIVIASDQIRFHAKPFFDATRYNLDSQAGETPLHDCAGALVSRLCNPLTGKATAIHRTLITPEAGNMKRNGKSMKWMLAGTGILKLCDPDGLGEAMPGLSIGEGLESSLAAMVRYGAAPMWATMTAQNMKDFPTLAYVEALDIWSDFDKINPTTGKRTGHEAAHTCAQRWADTGREARVKMPPSEGVDYADIQAGEAA